MKAQELRIGNKVFYKTIDLNTGNEIFNEITVTANDIKIIEMNYGFNRHFPIPLTEEWLLKLGFYKTYANSCYGIRFNPYSEHILYITLSSNAVIATIGDNYSSEGERLTVFTGKISQYVHQLQNLYHALTGEELTIKEEGK